MSWEGLRLNFLDDRKRVLEAEKREQKHRFLPLRQLREPGLSVPLVL